MAGCETDRILQLQNSNSNSNKAIVFLLFKKKGIQIQIQFIVQSTNNQQPNTTRVYLCRHYVVGSSKKTIKLFQCELSSDSLVSNCCSSPHSLFIELSCCRLL